MKTNKQVTIIDYGMGNIWSVRNALHYLGCDPKVSSIPDEIERADSLVLPGVGSFRKAMNALQESHLDQAIIHAVKIKDRKILGICLGMQLMGTRGSEDGQTTGLALIPSSVDRFSAQEVGTKKIPHIGFNQVHCDTDTHLFRGMSGAPDFYFVHSYRMLPDKLTGKISTCRYGIDFLAAYEQENIYATQFHPEKSQTNGLLVLKNFLVQ